MKIVNFNLLAFTSSMYTIEYIHSEVEEMRNERRNGIAKWIKNEYTQLYTMHVIILTKGSNLVHKKKFL